VDTPVGLYVAQLGVPLLVLLVVLALLGAAYLKWKTDAARQARHGPQPADGANHTPEAPFSGRHPYLLGALMVTAVFLAANHLLVRGQAAGVWDVDGQFFPYFVLLADHARAGQFLSWDPWTSGGMPVLGDPQFGAFSPLSYLVAIVTGGSSTGFRIYWLLIWWLGGMGILLLGRHLKAPAWGSVVVAIGFLFNGVYTGNAEHTSWLVGFSFLPWIVWRLDEALRRRSARIAAEAGALWGLSALSGYPGLVIITGCFAAIWAAGRAITSTAGEGPRTGVGRAVGSLLVFAIVGLIVLSPAYVSFFYEGAGTQSRVAALTRARAMADELPPGALATLANPYVTVLKLRHQELWPGSDVSMVNVYTGFPILVLAMVGLVRRRRSGWLWWIAGLTVLSLAAAMGTSLPVRGWLYDLFLPFRFFTHSSIFRLYFLFGLALLALYGAQALQRDAETSVTLRSGVPRVLFASVLLILLGSALAAARFLGSPWEAEVPHRLRQLGFVHGLFIAAGLIAIVLSAWVARGRWRRFALPALLIFLASADALIAGAACAPTMVRLGKASDHWLALDAQHESELDLTAHGWSRALNPCLDPSAPGGCRRNDQYVTKEPVLLAYSSEVNPYFGEIAINELLRPAVAGAQRVWFSPRVATMPPSRAAFTSFLDRTTTLGAMPIVVHRPEAMLAPPDRAEASGSGLNHPADSVRGPDGEVTAAADLLGELPAATPVDANLIAYSSRELTFETEAPEDGWLLVTDRWARSWRVEVNGDRQPLWAGNFVFRAVPVKRGRSLVSFHFHPIAQPYLVILSWGALGAVGVLGAVAAMSKGGRA
jgi:hypothetical protein